MMTFVCRTVDAWRVQLRGRGIIGGMNIYRVNARRDKKPLETFSVLADNITQANEVTEAIFTARYGADDVSVIGVALVAKDVVGEPGRDYVARGFSAGSDAGVVLVQYETPSELAGQVEDEQYKHEQARGREILSDIGIDLPSD